MPITDLTIKDDNLIVATQGRSLWIIDDLTVLHQLDESKKSASSVLFKPKDSYRTKGMAAKKPSKTSGQNLENGVITHFLLKNYSEKDTVQLTYTSMAGDTLANYSSIAKKKEEKLDLKKGGNTFVWDTRGKGATKLEGMIFWWASLDGAKAVPGDYKVHLNVNGSNSSETFTILPDPRAESSVAEMQQQFDFITDINTTIENAHQSIKKIRDVTKQLNSFTEQYKDDTRTKDLIEKAKVMKEKLGEVEKALYQTKNRSRQDPLNFPIKLTNKLGHLNSLVSIGDFPPTEQDIAVKNELTAKINKELQVFNEVISSELKEFNKGFNELNLNYLFIEEGK